MNKDDQNERRRLITQMMTMIQWKIFLYLPLNNGTFVCLKGVISNFMPFYHSAENQMLIKTEKVESKMMTNLKPGTKCAISTKCLV